MPPRPTCRPKPSPPSWIKDFAAQAQAATRPPSSRRATVFEAHQENAQRPEPKCSPLGHRPAKRPGHRRRGPRSKSALRTPTSSKRGKTASATNSVLRTRPVRQSARHQRGRSGPKMAACRSRFSLQGQKSAKCTIKLPSIGMLQLAESNVARFPAQNRRSLKAAAAWRRATRAFRAFLATFFKRASIREGARRPQTLAVQKRGAPHSRGTPSDRTCLLV